MEGRSEVADGRSELVRLAARLIIEEALEGEARDAVGRHYYARGATPGAGYRNGYLSAAGLPHRRLGAGMSRAIHDPTACREALSCRRDRKSVV